MLSLLLKFYYMDKNCVASYDYKLVTKIILSFPAIAENLKITTSKVGLSTFVSDCSNTVQINEVKDTAAQIKKSKAKSM